MHDLVKREAKVSHLISASLFLFPDTSILCYIIFPKKYTKWRYSKYFCIFWYNNQKKCIVPKLLSRPYPCNLHDVLQLCHAGGVGDFDCQPGLDRPQQVRHHHRLHHLPLHLGEVPSIQTWIERGLKAFFLSCMALDLSRKNHDSGQHRHQFFWMDPTIRVCL